MDVFDQENCNKVGQLHAAWMRLENLHHPQDFEDDQDWQRHRSMLNDAQDGFGKVLIDVETHIQSQIRLMKSQMLDATIDFRRDWLKMSKENDRLNSMLGQPPSPASDATELSPFSVPSGQHHITEYMGNLQVALLCYHYYALTALTAPLMIAWFQVHGPWSATTVVAEEDTSPRRNPKRRCSNVLRCFNDGVGPTYVERSE